MFSTFRSIWYSSAFRPVNSFCKEDSSVKLLRLCNMDRGWLIPEFPVKLLATLDTQGVVPSLDCV